MRKSWISGIMLGVAGSLLVAVPAQATNIGTDGCTPGYWKNHTDSWFETETQAIPSGTLLNQGSVGFHTTAALAGDSLLDALAYKGGPGAAGAERILMRAAAAAWLNAAHEGVGYPYRRWEDPFNIVGTTNSAIASGDRAAMLDVATALDTANNLGCTLN